MSSLLGALADYPFDAPGSHSSAPMVADRDEGVRRQEPSSLSGMAATGAEGGASSVPAEVHTFPYATLLRSLVEEGRILEARSLLDFAGDLIPRESRIREILAPPRIRRIPEKGFDRSAEIHWLKTNAELYRGKWVALIGDELIASAETLRDLLVRVNELAPARKPLVHRIE